LALTTRIIWKITEKISPSKEGIIPRNVRSRTANYYHIRSFLIKYGKNTFSKGVFPWISAWYNTFIGASKIGKGTTMEESMVNDKFIEVGENCYIGVNSVITSHLVDGVFGNISFFKVKVGNNITFAANNCIGPGTEVHDESYLLPMASTGKHSLLRGKGYYFSEGAKPLRKIFKRKIRSHLKIDPKTLKPISDTSEPVPSPEPTTPTEEEKKDLTLNITTSSAISRVNVKFLAVYIPIFWMAGLIVTIFWYWFLSDRNWEIIIPLLPLTIFASIYFFIFACMLFSKLFLILINLIHKPKEGVFRAEIGDKDFEFWMLRTELKKISLWLMRSSPFPWLDVLVFKLFGVNMDTSSFLYDTWCDGEFIQFGRKNLIGQGANIMSSMVVGKYLIIRKVIIDDYVLVGGMTSVAPGTMAGKEALLGAISFTVYNQILDPGWVYLGMPMTKYKPNKYAESRRDVISKKDVDEKKRFNIEYEINIDEDKKNNKG
jgi:acetyltransferase-like isoleucine patch superfamily enzyme